ETVHVAPRPRLSLRPPESAVGAHLLVGDVAFGYGRHAVGAAVRKTAIVDREASRVYVRDRDREEELRARLDELGFRRAAAGGYAERHDVLLLRRDFVRAVSALVGEGWRVEAEGERLRAAGAWKVGVASGVDWFDVVGEVDFGGVAVPFPEVLE